MGPVVPAALAVALLCAPAGAEDPPTFRFGGSVGDEGQRYLPNFMSPLNPGNVLDLRRDRNAADATSFADLTLPDRADKLHLKVRATSSNADGQETLNRLTFDEAYWQHSFSEMFDMTAGRKIEKWGTGYAWNPTGFVNPPKNPSDPNDRLSSNRGLDMVELGIFVRDWNLALIALTAVDWKGPYGTMDQTAYAARAYRLIHGTDVSFMARWGYGARSQGFSLSRVFGDALELHGEAAWTQNAVRMVPQWVAVVSQPARFAKYVLGGQYTFPHDINLVVEYFHNSNGYTREEWGTFRNAVRTADQQLAAGNPLPLLGLNAGYTGSSIGRDYGFQRLYVPLSSDRFQLELIGLENLRDGSGLVQDTATWKLRSGLKVYAAQTEFWGGPASEFHYLQIRRMSFVGFRWYF